MKRRSTGAYKCMDTTAPVAAKKINDGKAEHFQNFKLEPRIKPEKASSIK